MLEAAGIQGYVPGQYLADEWGATQRILGNVGTDVFVPQSRLEDAREIIAQSRPGTERGSLPKQSEAPRTCPKCGESVDPGFEVCWSCGTELTGAAIEPPPPDLKQGGAKTEAAADDVQRSPTSRHKILFELIAVSIGLIVPIYIPVIADISRDGLRYFSDSYSPWPGLEEMAYWIPTIVILRWIISVTGEPASHFGWVPLQPRRDLIAVVGTAFSLCFVWLIVGGVLVLLVGEEMTADVRSVLFGPPSTEEGAPRGVVDWAVCIAAIAIGALMEESLIRGWFLVRLRDLLGSPIVAALLSSVVWAGYHVYQGAAAVLLHYCEGLVLAAAFLITRRLWPLVVVHAGINVMLLLRDA